MNNLLKFLGQGFGVSTFISMLKTFFLQLNNKFSNQNICVDTKKSFSFILCKVHLKYSQSSRSSK